MPHKIFSICVLPFLLFLKPTAGDPTLTPVPPTLDPLMAIISAGNPGLLDPLTTNEIEDALLEKVKDVLAKNWIPRFKIPRGNLASLMNPHWEVLYFLKYGRFPISKDKNAKDRTQKLLDRLRHIRIILDRKSGMIAEFLRQALDEFGKDAPDLFQTNYSSSAEGMHLPMFDPDLFFTFQGPLGTYFPNKQEAADIVREYERIHGEIKEGASGPPENEENNFLDGLTLSLKSKENSGAVENEKNKRDGILKYFMNRAAALNSKPREDPDGIHDPRAQWMKTFLVDHDPNWVKQRMRNGSGKPQVVQRSDVDDRRRALYASEGRGISSRSGGGSAGSAGGGQDTGNSNLDDASPRRKFQTQGW